MGSGRDDGVFAPTVPISISTFYVSVVPSIFELSRPFIHSSHFLLYNIDPRDSRHIKIKCIDVVRNKIKNTVKFS